MGDTRRFAVVGDDGKIDRSVIPDDVLTQWGPLTIGTVSTGPASASISGDVPNQVLNLTIPQGESGADGTTLSRMDFVLPGELQVGFSAACMMPEGPGWIRRIAASVGVRPASKHLLVDIQAATVVTSSNVALAWASVFASSANQINFGNSGSLTFPQDRFVDRRSYARADVSPSAGWAEDTLFRVAVTRVSPAGYAQGEDLTVSLFWEMV